MAPWSNVCILRKKLQEVYKQWTLLKAQSIVYLVSLRVYICLAVIKSTRSFYPSSKSRLKQDLHKYKFTQLRLVLILFNWWLGCVYAKLAGPLQRRSDGALCSTCASKRSQHNWRGPKAGQTSAGVSGTVQTWYRGPWQPGQFKKRAGLGSPKFSLNFLIIN